MTYIKYFPTTMTKEKKMKKVFLLILAFLVSCETVSVNEEKPTTKSPAAETRTFSIPETDREKVVALNAAYTKKGDDYYPNIPPILIEAEKIFADVGMSGKRINEIPKAVKKTVITNILMRVYKRLPEYTALKAEKYSDCTNDLTYNDIEKGDIILSITHNNMLMAIDGENVVHHATLCVKKPENNADTAFITIEGVGKTTSYFSLNDIRENDDAAYVLRCKNITTAQINTIAKFTESQLGKPYNTNFTNKEDEESFYCTSLVWQSYRAAEIEIDFNHDEINDYGVVLATDIYKSPNLKLVKYSY